jgi:4-amino-4-deoxy-L-arabinose transferase-like glycosyltransferase
MQTVWSSLSAATRVFVACAAAITVARLGALMLSPIDLHFDEAQYWAWSRSLEFGYFSKPPLIAWAIAATTSVFGNGEAAVRLAAPLGHLAGAIALFALGRRLYGPWTGVMAGIGWLLLPGVTVSSSVISTDALMLPFWACALFAFFRFVDAPGWRAAALLGVLIGLGALGKYAMLYFLLCAGLASVWAPRLRARLISADGALALGAALVVVSPNLIWNAMHGFATVGHTASNANLSGELFNPGEMIEFLFSQIGILGPVLWAVLGILLIGAWRNRASLKETDRILIAFILVPLVFITAQALLSRAHANWAAAAYPAAVVWMAGALTERRWGRGALIAAGAVNALAALVFMACAVVPSFADGIGVGKAFKRARAWEDVCLATAARAERAPYQAIVVDHRALFFALSYYCRPEALPRPLPPIRMWMLREEPANHAAMSAPMSAEVGQLTLGVNLGQGYVQLVHDDFAAAAFTDETVIDLGGGETRWVGFSDLSGFQPVRRDAAFAERINGPNLALPPVSALPAADPAEQAPMP